MRRANIFAAGRFNTDVVQLAETLNPSFAAQLLGGHLVPQSVDNRFRWGSIDLSRVVSVEHSRYVGRTWGDLLGIHGYRSPLRNVDDPLWELTKSPAYFIGRRKKPGWSCYEVDGVYYLMTGYHRSVVGRFFLELNGLSPVVHGVRVATMGRAAWVSAQRAAQKSSFECMGENDVCMKAAQ